MYAQDYPQHPRDAYLMPAATTSSLTYNERGAADSAPSGYLRQGDYFVPVSVCVSAAAITTES